MPARPLYTAPDVIKFELLLVPPLVVSIAFVVTALVPLPINTSPLARVVTPVPPLPTPTVFRLTA